MIKPEPSLSLVLWLSECADKDLFITSFTIAEISRGILEMPVGKKRAALEAWFAGGDGPQTQFAGRVLPFDEKAGLVWAQLMAEGKAAGRSRSAVDMILASVAIANACVIVTDNERHFAGLNFINPLRTGL